MNCESSISISELRKIIDTIDKEIIFLLKKRCNISKKIALYKIKKLKPIKDHNRETEILNNITSISLQKKLNPEYVKKIFKIIIHESVITQEITLKKNKNFEKRPKNKFFILGPLGSYSHLAINSYINQEKINNPIILESKNFQEIIQKTEESKNNYCILPIYNNCSGAIDEVYDLLQKTNLTILSEQNVLINHHLWSIRPTLLDDIKTIYTHMQPLQQCSKFIKNYPHWNIIYTESSSSAMKKISSNNDPTVAAIGGELSGKIYNLSLLKKNISNLKKNITSFIVLRSFNTKNINDDDDYTVHHKKKFKITIMVITNIHSNDIINILYLIKNNNIILNRLESRPSLKNSLQQTFFIEILIKINLELIKKMLKNINLSNTTSIKILGYYPTYFSS